ncbi:hypothetical protein [Burkholderia phage BCSR5]|nr:hypothetical protein [Burkholderia phage BCSR5]
MRLKALGDGQSPSAVNAFGLVLLFTLAGLGLFASLTAVIKMLANLLS